MGIWEGAEPLGAVLDGRSLRGVSRPWKMVCWVMKREAAPGPGEDKNSSQAAEECSD